jgi:hypothetical protein
MTGESWMLPPGLFLFSDWVLERAGGFFDITGRGGATVPYS